MSKFKTETELAAVVVKWLDKFTVYQEVESPTGGVADIVVDLDGIAWIIECKLSFNFKVLEQAAKWKMYGAPMVSIAIPRSTKRDDTFPYQIASWKGIGVLQFEPTPGYVSAIERLRPQFTRPPKTSHPAYWNLLDHCTDQHKTYCEAGSKNGRWTPFKETVSNLTEIVDGSPGITMKDAVDQMEKHHYRNSKAAVRNLLHWLRKGVITEVEAIQEGRSLRLYPSKALEAK